MTVLRFKISPHEADRILDSLPMPREWWRKVATRFLELYHMTPDELRAVNAPRTIEDATFEAFVCVKCDHEVTDTQGLMHHAILTGHTEWSARATIDKVLVSISVPQSPGAEEGALDKP